MTPLATGALVIYGSVIFIMLVCFLFVDNDLSEKKVFMSVAWPLVLLRYICRGAKDWWTE